MGLTEKQFVSIHSIDSISSCSIRFHSIDSDRAAVFSIIGTRSMEIMNANVNRLIDNLIEMVTDSDYVQSHMILDAKLNRYLVRNKIHADVESISNAASVELKPITEIESMDNDGIRNIQETNYPHVVHDFSFSIDGSSDLESDSARDMNIGIQNTNPGIDCNATVVDSI
ncbi:hypothetical protein L1887_17432 [Cichorium endivia]|nr:hypothetical protein L1887_17432 [Cichorium endivia]